MQKKNNLYSIDRFEGEYAILEHNGDYINILKSTLPLEVKEGDILEFTDNCFNILHNETNDRRNMLIIHHNKILNMRTSNG